jgi:hypothetical protein
VPFISPCAILHAALTSPAWCFLTAPLLLLLSQSRRRTAQLQNLALPGGKGEPVARGGLRLLRARWQFDGMPTRLVHLVIDAADPPGLARFWSAALGWEIAAEEPSEVEVGPRGYDYPDPVALPLAFVPVPEPKMGKNRIHLDLATTSEAHQAAEVSRVLSLGATHADIGQGEVPWVVLADPEGNEFCVLDPRPVYRDTGPVARPRAGSGTGRVRASPRCGHPAASGPTLSSCVPRTSRPSRTGCISMSGHIRARTTWPRRSGCRTSGRCLLT